VVTAADSPVLGPNEGTLTIRGNASSLCSLSQQNAPTL
jgi:hypothetical protein